MFKHRIRRGSPREEGSAVVETVIGVFGLALVLCAVVEFSSWAIACSALDDAAYAACRALAQNPEAAAGELEDAAAAASPSLAGALAIERDVSAAVPTRYTHHLPNGAGDRESRAAGRKVSVTASCSFEPVTVVGRIVTGGSDVTLSASSTISADATVEGGASQW